MSDTRTTTKPAESPADDRNPDEGYLHTVGWWEHLTAGVLRWRIPRALCGQSLAADPDQPEVTPASPPCPACQARNRHTGALHWVPGQWR
ncbi:hypothetical protein ACFROC_22935 [Nocardia tengchongensis]|uniref:hypothetical protein n=1 Tax=Nocardia tengchongensis TaxID=2055889 RepID=UPI003698E625